MNPIRGMMRFMQGSLRLPLVVQLWLVVLMTANMAVPFVYLDRLEAQAVLAAAMVGAMSMGFLTDRYGFSRILGAGHVPWLVLLPWLATRLDAAAPGTAFYLWLLAVMILNGASLVLDAVDVVRWIRGERAQIVP